MDEIIAGCRVIGEPKFGGMARVYPATQLSMNRKVALKVLDPRFERDEEYVARFRREVGIAGDLVHNHIVRTYDAQTKSSPYCIVMEFLEGGTVRSRLAEEPLEIEQAVSIARAMCSALEYAHEQGIIHRDVTPANIMFDKHDRPVLTDFGIARSTEGSPLTGSDKRWGNPFYMSPEQVRGLRLDRRTDVFSLGATLYEMVTGEAPFGKDTGEVVMHRISSTDPAPPSSLNPRVSRRLEAAILRALARNPDERFQTCAEMAAALEAAILPMVAIPGETTPPTLPPVEWPPGGRVRRRRWRVGWAPFMLLALALGCAGLAVHVARAAMGNVFRPAEVVSQGQHRVVLQTDAVLEKVGAGVKLVRRYSPEDQNRGEFGPGWRVHTIYRLAPSRATRVVQGEPMPEEVTLTDGVTGKEEVFRLETDTSGGSGYVPPGVGDQRVIYPMVDGYYALMDGREHLCQFDQAGRLAVVTTARDVRYGYAYEGERVASIWGVPVRLEPGTENVKIDLDQGVIIMPKEVTLDDRPGSVVFTFQETGIVGPGYYPGDSRRWRGISIMANGFRLADQWGNIHDFDGTGEWAASRVEARMKPGTESGCPAIVLGYDDGGHVTQAEVGDQGKLSYSYDEKGRLSAFSDLEGKTVQYRYGRKGQLLVRTVETGGASGWAGHVLWVTLALLALALAVSAWYAGRGSATEVPATTAWRQGSGGAQR